MDAMEQAGGSKKRDLSAIDSVEGIIAFSLDDFSDLSNIIVNIKRPH